MLTVASSTRSVTRPIGSLARRDNGSANARTGAAVFQARAELRDGTPVCIRAIQPGDKELLRIAFERLSARSVYRRFFLLKKSLTPGDLRQLTELDFVDHVGLALTVDEAGGERLIAVGRFVRDVRGSDHADVAFAVADDYQHHGAATLLLQHLVVFARERGVRAFTADMLEDNQDMLDVFRNSGLPLRQTIEAGIRRVVLALEAPRRQS